MRKGSKYYEEDYDDGYDDVDEEEEEEEWYAEETVAQPPAAPAPQASITWQGGHGHQVYTLRHPCALYVPVCSGF